MHPSRSHRAASFSFAVVTTLAILSGIFTLAHQSEVDALHALGAQGAASTAAVHSPATTAVQPA